MTKIKANVELKDMDQAMAKEVLISSIEQNEKQLCVYLIQKEVEGETEENVAQINGINAYIKGLNKLLITKFG